MNGIRDLVKETPENGMAPSTMWGHSEQGPFMMQELDSLWQSTYFFPECEKYICYLQAVRLKDIV